MKFWHLEEAEMWERHLARGYMMGNPDYYMFPEEYLWMVNQMEKRLPNYDGSPPIWLWTHKIDLRTSRCEFAKGQKYVRLTLDLDPADVLISNFEGWNNALNNGFCGLVESDWDYDHTQEDIEKSWENIFIPHLPKDLWGNEQWFQATSGRIDINKVVKVSYHTGAGKLFNKISN